MAKSSTSGQGRPKGASNKATREIKDIARSYGPEVIQRLWTLAMGAESEAAQVAACKEILDRGYGKSVAIAELTIDDKRDNTDWTRAELVAFLDNARNGGKGTADTDGCSEQPDQVH